MSYVRLAGGVVARVLNREQVEEEIERLIALLDVMDGDSDLEPSDDCELEPSLGSTEGIVSQINWGSGPLDDLEDEHDGHEPCGYLS